MEGVDSVSPIDLSSVGPAFTAGVMDDTPDLASDDDDEWEVQSVLSDTPSEALVDEDEDDVVPLIFKLPNPVDLSSDRDHTEFDGQLSVPPPNPQEKHASPFMGVYGSHSKNSISFPPIDSLLIRTVTELHYEKPLSDVGYALNKVVKAVICIGCQRGIPIDMLQTHSRDHHRGRSILSSEEQSRVLQQLSLAGYRTSKIEKYHQPPAQKPVDGLEVLSGFRCPLQNKDGTLCEKAFLAQSTFTRHLSDHPGRSKLDPSSCTSYIQTLFTQGNLQCYFSVDPSLSDLDPSTTSAYAYAIKLLGTLPKAQIPAPDHDKDRASIHWFTRWPELLKPYANDKGSLILLQSLVSFPEPGSDPDWLVKLWDHGCRWWNDVESAHASCSYRASTMLKSHQGSVLSLRSLSQLLTSPCCLGMQGLGKSYGSQRALGVTVAQPYHLFHSV